MRSSSSSRRSWSLIAGGLILAALNPNHAGGAAIDTEFHVEWAWSVGGRDVGYRGLEIVDLDGDGREEILVASDTGLATYWYVLEHQEGTLVQTFSSLPLADGLLGLASGSEGGSTRIVAAGSSSLTVYDGATKREIASFATPYASERVLAVADVDSDGILDAVTCDSTDLYVYELLLGTVRTKLGFGCSDLAIGQTDTDPQLEIAIAGNPAGGFVLDGASLGVDWTDPSGFGGHVCLGDFDADGHDEVASLVASDGIRVQDPETGGLIWEAPASIVSDLVAANLDTEIGSELVWSSPIWGPIHILDGATSAELRTIESPDEGARKIAIGDTDADGIANLLWSSRHSSSYLYLARADTGTIEARTEDWSGPFSGIGVGDFEGDGSVEVASASHQRESGYAGGGPFVLSFATGRLKRFASTEWGGPSTDNLVGFDSAQLDGDVQLELCVLGGRSIGCFDGADFSEQWRVPMDAPKDTLAISDLDGDTYPELLVGAADAMVSGTVASFAYAFEGENGWLKWRTPPVIPWYPGINRLDFLDILGGSRREVLATSATGPDSRLWAYDAISGLVAAGPWTTDVQSMRPAPPAIASGELLLGRSNGEIVGFDVATGTPGTVLATFPGPVLAFDFADFDRDGTLDVAALLDDHFEVMDGETGLTLYVSPFLGGYGVQPESFLVGDFDGNHVAEILVATGAGIALFKAPLFLLFADGFESGATSNW